MEQVIAGEPGIWLLKQQTVQTKIKEPIVIAIDGTSASGKSTNSKLVARALGFVHVDTGAMYRTLAWHCLQQHIDPQHVRLLVSGYYPAEEIRTAGVSAAVPHVAAVPNVRDWMKKKQRECIKFGNLVMEGRDIGTNVFPETDFKYYLDAGLEERSRRRAAEGVQENLAARDLRDSQRAAAPLMIALGARVINNSQMTSEQTSGLIIADIRRCLAEREASQGKTRR